MNEMQQDGERREGNSKRQHLTPCRRIIFICAGEGQAKVKVKDGNTRERGKEGGRERMPLVSRCCLRKLHTAHALTKRYNNCQMGDRDEGRRTRDLTDGQT